MGRRPKQLWAWHDETLYVKAKYCGIHTLILFTDGFTFYQFKGDKNMYLKAADCLNWFKEELEYGREHGCRKKESKEYEQFIELYSKAIDGTLGNETQEADIVNVDSIETDVLLDRWRYYLQGLPYTSLVNLLKDARQMGLNVCPLHRLKKKRKYNIRKQIEYAFVESEQFQNRVHNALKAYFCKHCGGRRAERCYNKGFDDCTCSR